MANIGTSEKFAKKAAERHAGKYDYSKVEYRKATEKVVIICPVHGEFSQTPQNHLKGQGCPRCAVDERAKRQRGDGNPMRDPVVKAKAAATCRMRYGAKTYAESKEGRRVLHEIGSKPDTIAKWQSTCMQRYGAKTWSESEIGRTTLSEKMSSVEMKDKVRAGYMACYGVPHFMQTESARAAQAVEISRPEHRAVLSEGLRHKYGVPYATMDKEMMQKAYRTKKLNGTFNTSRPEEILYVLLCEKYGSENVKRQYKDLERYPYLCDFYVVTDDLFIELNASWTHGGHWFDNNNQEDVIKLESWKSKGGPYYMSAVRMWSERDPAKRDCAERNHINYLVFWDQDLADAKAWLGM